MPCYFIYGFEVTLVIMPGTPILCRTIPGHLSVFFFPVTYLFTFMVNCEFVNDFSLSFILHIISCIARTVIFWDRDVKVCMC